MVRTSRTSRATWPRRGLGGGGGVDGGFDDGAGFGVEPEPVLGDVAADVVPAGQHGQPAVPVLHLLQQQTQAVPGQQRRPDPAHPGRAVELTHRHQPGRHRVHRGRFDQRGQLGQLGRDHAPRRHRQARPSATAARAPSERRRPTSTPAASSRTALATSPASRASRVGHRSATHCGTDPACDCGHLTPGDRLRGQREPARPRGRRQRVDHRQHHIQVRTGQRVHPPRQLPQHLASRRTARRPAPRRRSAPRCPYPHPRTHHRQPPTTQSRSSTTKFGTDLSTSP